MVGDNGAGKAQPLCSKIRVPGGWSTIGKISVGDFVITHDGNTSIVTSIPFEGETDVYEVIFKDGRKTKCSDNHLWNVWSIWDNKWQWKVVSLNELQDQKHKKYVQLAIPECIENVELPIDPYLLGVLIGDGSFTSSSISICNFDAELIDRVRNIIDNIPPRLVKLQLNQIGDRVGQFRIVHGLKYDHHRIKDSLDKLGLLGHSSYQKFIPEIYKNSSVEQKLELIRGLMDTDGTCDKHGSISYCTTSEQLAKDFQELIWSIGGICRIQEKHTTYTHKKIKRNGRVSYNCYIRYHTPSALFHLTRKQDRCREYQYSDCLRLELSEINHIGKDKTKCISIDSPEQLYVTDDYIVTHNSTILDAIMFGLFGRAHRNINKPNLVNSINQKELLVEIEFSMGKNDYVVRRGIKPNVFEIYKNDALVNQNADNRDYQDFFEKNVLKMNYKTFSQIVMLGSANFVPFMQLPAAGRREFIEDLLDLQIFSTMNVLLKNRINENKTSFRDLEVKLEIAQKSLSITDSHIEVLKSNTEKQKEDKLAKIKQYEDENRRLAGVIVEFEEELNDILSSLTELQKIRHSWDVQQLAVDQATKKKKSLDKMIVFYTKNCACPTCKQEISQEFKDRNLSEYLEMQETANKYIETQTVLLNEYQKQIETWPVFDKDRIGTERKISSLKSDIALNIKFIEQMNKELDTISKSDDLTDQVVQQTRYKTEIDELKTQKEELTKQRETLTIAATLLKDGGIKAKIVRQYVPVINEVINRYLNDMEFPISFELNEDFTESIRSSFRDSFMYSSFSEGEKVRINLALLFAWREIARMRNSASTNLLLMDEILDGSLDAEGMEEFLKVLNTVSPDTNIFIISHKFNLHDKFDRVLEFKKTKNFSRIVQ